MEHEFLVAYVALLSLVGNGFRWPESVVSLLAL